MEKQNNNYILGIIGALLGALIASIPWVLVYVYGNMILSLLAIIIALGAVKGYKLLKGKLDKKTPIIIIVISLLAVTLSTLVIIPALLLIKDGFELSISNMNLLYDSSEFMSALLKDYVISLIFTALGISGVIAKVKGEVEDLED